MSSEEIIRGRVVTPEGVVDGYVTVDGDRIAAVGEGDRGDGHWLLPGFVDIHNHGGGGHSFTTGDPDAARQAAAFHLRHGTTSLLASLVSSPYTLMRQAVTAFAPLVAEGVLAGIHFEGPYLSEVRCGAQNPAFLRDPSLTELTELLALGEGTIRMVTVAPERDGALAAIELLVGHGVVAAVGHTDATYQQTRAAVAAGATVATHLFNGMRPLHHREPGPIGTLLTDQRVTVELICDLVHLHPSVVRLAAEHAGPGRTVLVTDAISATDAGDGTYRLGNLPVTVRDGQARLADGSLAGSTLTMDAAFRNLVVSCGVGITDAVAAASTTPARLLGLGGVTGSIEPGLAADLVVLDEQLQVTGVLKDGSWVQR